MVERMAPFKVQKALARLDGTSRFSIAGRVRRVVGPIVEASALDVAMGELCEIVSTNAAAMEAEVVGFHDSAVQLVPLGTTDGIHPGALVHPTGRTLEIAVGDALVGRVIDARGRPIDGDGPVLGTCRRPISAPPPNPLERARISAPLATGVRVIDGLVSFARGQRVGIFAGSGVGKSVLLGMIARHSTADVNVIALLGERGREVREFVERDLGDEGLRRSVVVVATSDEVPLLRAKGALAATAVAEHFREQGRHVLLMLDSLTRVAMAWREIGLSAGEPPTTKGYPPSVFSHLPRLLERAGNGVSGSISGLYTVLVEGDDFNEPVADAARAILDGHVVLDRSLASAGQFPAVDPLQSVSRLRDHVIDDDHRRAAETILRLQAAYRDHEDLIAVGAYKAGANPDVDAAVSLRARLLEFLRQRPIDGTPFEETRKQLCALAAPSPGSDQ